MRSFLKLPPEAKAEYRLDRSGLSPDDPGIDRVIETAVAWIGRAQDDSSSRDGGVAHNFSLIDGWSKSYPETTGYIVPTMIAVAKLLGDETARQRAIRMLDWLTSIQFPDGSFPGGIIDEKPIVPVAFNTGQILLGLAVGARELGEQYREAMQKAADWLTRIQDADGCWRKHSSPFAISGERAYDTHIAWGLIEAAREEPGSPYADAALANIHWVLNLQHDNGWFEKCCLSDPSQPLTHTLGYILRGVIEAYRFTDDENLLRSCQRTADGLLPAVREDGFLPGRLDSGWHGTVSWACLTGSVQIAICLLMLYRYTENIRYREAAYRLNQYVRRTIRTDGPPEILGGIKGSFPVNGEYGAYRYLNWACKFFIDSNMLEKTIREGKDQIHESMLNASRESIE